VTGKQRRPQHTPTPEVSGQPNRAAMSKHRASFLDAGNAVDIRSQIRSAEDRVSLRGGSADGIGQFKDRAHLKRIFATLAELLQTASASLDHDRDAAQQSIESALALLGAADCEQECHGAIRVQGGLAPWQTARLRSYIEANLRSNIAITELQAITKLSRAHFTRAFKSSFGDTPQIFLIRRRVARAQFLMITTDEALSQIALACGLCDQSHLSRLFRRFVGTTPSVWRRAHRLQSD
jgi:AraC family transcriptional regulator